MNSDSLVPNSLCAAQVWQARSDSRWTSRNAAAGHSYSAEDNLLTGGLDSGAKILRLLNAGDRAWAQLRLTGVWHRAKSLAIHHCPYLILSTCPHLVARYICTSPTEPEMCSLLQHLLAASYQTQRIKVCHQERNKHKGNTWTENRQCWGFPRQPETKQGTKLTTNKPPVILQSKRNNHARVHQNPTPGRGTAAKVLSTCQQKNERDGYNITKNATF